MAISHLSTIFPEGKNRYRYLSVFKVPNGLAGPAIARFRQKIASPAFAFVRQFPGFYWREISH
ncbi:hypothetical protein [Pseudomonas sp. 273]|uniref:hypothetical protein n=1 Tax=Pseudomonas sp. 273 TaxID=75692 RepID=UPI0023D871E1|nr:hypothetical protein [Pseudomonas sp. 273]